MFHPLRGTILDLLLERAATVEELSVAIGRPTSTIAYPTDLPTVPAADPTTASPGGD